MEKEESIESNNQLEAKEEFYVLSNNRGYFEFYQFRAKDREEAVEKMEDCATNNGCEWILDEEEWTRLKSAFEEFLKER